VNHLPVNGKAVVVSQATLASGETIIWTDVTVPPTAEVIVPVTSFVVFHNQGMARKSLA
jgi:hypothetical protein